MVFAIIAFAVVAQGSGSGQVNFCIFCGVTTFVFALLFMALYLAGVTWVSPAGLLLGLLGLPGR